MSGSWHGGKGDKSRIEDLDVYNRNYNKIFRKTMGYKLFLDDYRNPKDGYLHDHNISLFKASATNAEDWYIVRSYKSFVAAIQNKGIPDVVSFDNDLNNTHMNAYFQAEQTGFYSYEGLTETGYHCAQYLKQVCKEKGVKFPVYYVHSANRFARKLIPEMIERDD